MPCLTDPQLRPCQPGGAILLPHLYDAAIADVWDFEDALGIDSLLSLLYTFAKVGIS